ncbi:hypothetical protein TomTYG75_10970 [Sphingobium sp. TomTYG75]
MGARAGASGCASARRISGRDILEAPEVRPRDSQFSFGNAKPISLTPVTLRERRSFFIGMGAALKLTKPIAISAPKPATSRRAFNPNGGAAAGKASLSPLDATIVSTSPTGIANRISATASPASTAGVMAL